MQRLLKRWGRAVVRLSAPLMLGFLMLVEAAIFLLDIDTGAGISFAPFLSVPTALAAWFLGRVPSVVFVILSSAARVYRYSVHQPAGEGQWMLLYAFGQSLAYFGAVALLVRYVRRLFDRLSQQAHHFSHLARAERHHRFLDATIRRAVPADVEGILRLAVTGGEAGGFDQAVQDRVRQEALANNFKHGIQEGVALRAVWTGGSTAVPIEFWVSTVEGKLAGFMMILGMDAQKGPERELHAVAVDTAYRGTGVGSALVDFFCEHYAQRRLFSACKPGSRMMEMLKRRGFREHSPLEGEYQTLVLG